MLAPFLHPWAPTLAILHPKALSWLQGCGFDDASARDLWQGLCADFLRTRVAPRDEHNPQGYVWRSLRRRVARVHGVPTLSLQEVELVEEDTTPFEAACEAEAGSAVRAEIERLPDHYRQVVSLRYLQGHSVAEVAEVLSIPSATVKTRTHRGLALIKPKLERYQGLAILLVRQAAMGAAIVAAFWLPTGNVTGTEVKAPVEPVAPQAEPVTPEPVIHEPVHIDLPYAEGWVYTPMPEA